MLTESIPPDVLMWLMRSLIVATAWFGLGGFLLCLTREPVRRTLLSTLSLGGGLLIPLACLVLGDGGWSLGATLPLPTEIAVTRDGPVASTGRGSEEDSAVSALRSSGIASLNPAASEPVRTPETAPSNAPGSQVSLAKPAVSNTAALPPQSPLPNGSTPADLSRPGTLTLPVPEHWWHPSLLVVGYVLGMSVCLGWYLVGLLGVWMLVRNAGHPSPELQQLWNEVRGPDLQRVPLLVSSRVPQPIACWRGGPCVLLPAAWETAAGDRLRWALAHEAEHVRRADFWTWQVANVARCVYWCHPLAWWLRNELRQAQDYVADGAAARLDAGPSSPAVVEYAEFLTVSARSRVGGSSLVGLGLFGRRSDLYRRVAMLLKREGAIERRAPKWWKVACITWGIGLFVTVTTMRVVATPDTDSSRAEKSVDRIITAPLPSDRATVVASGGPAFALPGAASPYGASPYGASGPGPMFDPFSQAGTGPLLAGGPGVSASRAGDPSVSFTPSGVRKLEITDGFVEPEPGVALGKAIIHDTQGGQAWGMDGNAPPVGGEELFGEGAGMAAGGEGGMSMMSGGFPGAIGVPGMGGMGNVITPIPPLPENHRMRTVALLVRRPGPTGISTSIDGQTALTSSNHIAERKISRFLHAGYWPQDQMVGSVGIRFASSTVKREIISKNPEGETFPAAELAAPDEVGDRLAVLGKWWGGNDLSTRIPFEHAAPPGMPFVIRVEATDLDGQRHAGRIEHRPRQMLSEGAYSGGGSYYGSPPLGGEELPEPEIEPESWTIVFAHLPPSRIKSVRIAWHPYAWVIFRNVSLEAGHETKPTAELFIDASSPPALQVPAAPSATPSKSEQNTFPASPMVIPPGMRVLSVNAQTDGSGFVAGQMVRLCAVYEVDGSEETHDLLWPVKLFATSRTPNQYSLLLTAGDEIQTVRMVSEKAKLMLLAPPDDPASASGWGTINPDVLKALGIEKQPANDPNLQPDPLSPPTR